MDAHLTRRQKQVGELVAKGMSDKQIAKQLGMTPRTVKFHVQEAAAKIPLPGKARYRVTVFFLSLDDTDAA